MSHRDYNQRTVISHMVGLYILSTLLQCADSLNVKLAVIVSEKNTLFSRRKIEPAINIAKETIENLTLNVEPITMEFVYADSGCDIAMGIAAAIDFYIDYKISAFFGPVCDYALAPVARQVKLNFII